MVNARDSEPTLKRQVRRMGTAVLMCVAFLLALGTYVAYTNSKEPLGPRPETIKLLIGAIAVVLLLLAGIVGRRVGRLRRAIRRGSVGSRLQTRIVLTFSLVTIIPTVMISVFSAVLLQYGIKSWFDTRVETALQESVAVAAAYLEEHKATLRADAVAMSSDISRELSLMSQNPQLFTNILNNQVALRDLNEAVVMQNGRVVALSRLSFSLMFETLPADVVARAQQGEIPLVDQGDRIMAVSMLDGLTNTFLLTTRLVDPKVIQHNDQANGAVNQYKKLQKQISKLQYLFFLVFVLVALLLLLAVVWYGMLFASRLVVPLSRLINATERVRAGDFSLKLEAGEGDDELTTLTRRFNRMTSQLRAQRDDITQANRLLDERRRFSETVLEGVSAGVIALDPEQKIRLCNKTGLEFLEMEALAWCEGQKLSDFVPSLAELLKLAQAEPTIRHQADITHPQEQRTLTLHARIIAEMQGAAIAGYIVTFDDISPLLNAQRRAAWADVARRVAHEIKNPLTPIQLSAERLRKKFEPQGAEEKEAFHRYLDTILRHLKDIGHIVEEFVSFARMPTPKFKRERLLPILQKAEFSAETGFGIDVALHVPDAGLSLNCDEGLMSQVFTNLLKNACEGISRRPTSEYAAPGHVDITARAEQDKIIIAIADNGVGLPEDKLDSLTEPYVTTREKGTGLGLAIVKKIVEDHKGSMSLGNLSQGGACVTLTFPLEVEGHSGN